MNTFTNPPERLAEILQEILALSDAAGTSQSDSASGGDSKEHVDPQRAGEESQRATDERSTHHRR